MIIRHQRIEADESNLTSVAVMLPRAHRFSGTRILDHADTRRNPSHVGDLPRAPFARIGRYVHPAWRHGGTRRWVNSRDERGRQGRRGFSRAREAVPQRNECVDKGRDIERSLPHHQGSQCNADC
jgi:hypothetical protein